MSKSRIPLLIIPLGQERDWFPELGTALETHLPVKPFIADPLPIEAVWEAGPGRLSADAVLDGIGTCARGLGGWVLGVTDADLVAPGRDFVFGEAEITGCCAVVGTRRLGSPGSDRSFLPRLAKEALHELGHVAGLPHCPNPSCVMYPSVDVPDTDRKAARFCAPCGDALHNLLGTRIA